MGYDVFISYVEEDLIFANDLVSSLAKRNISCWIDHREIDESLDLNWPKEIFNTITGTPKLSMVVLLSANTLQSRHVEREIGLADENNVLIIPVRIENIKLTESYAYYMMNKKLIDAFEHDIDFVADKICVTVKRRKNLASDCKKSAHPPVSPTKTHTPTLSPKPTLKRFVDNGDQTMTDTSTGLMWTKDANLAGRKDWQEALDYVESMNKGAAENFGYTDWRLPAKEELESIIKGSEDAPHVWLKPEGFANVQSYYYWSSTTYASNTSDAWIVGMGVGYVYADGKSYFNYVWPVRSGH
ncbi:MAG: DUF1566 domain-containing protein [Nitrospirae bacterium]|nr:DUF1566 domain-containing protein [Nitrospirota bacterium]